MMAREWVRAGAARWATWWVSCTSHPQERMGPALMLRMEGSEEAGPLRFLNRHSHTSGGMGRESHNKNETVRKCMAW